MAYPEDLSSKYNLRSYDFAVNDNDKLPYNEDQFKRGYRNADESATDSVPDAHNVNWIYDILYANLRYTKDTAIENKNLLANKIATPTTIGQIKVGQGLKILSDGTLMLETPISGDKQSITYDIPVGMFMLWSGSAIPEYFIEPDGTSRLKTDYPELLTYATENNLYGEGKLIYEDPEDNTKFIVSDMRDNFVRIVGSEGVGTHTNDGLPSLGVLSSGTHTHTGTTDAGGIHTHNVTLSLSKGTFIVRGDDDAYPADSAVSGIVTKDTKNGTAKILENTGGGSQKTYVTKFHVNPSGSVSVSNSASHTHPFSISSSGAHTHTVTHSAETRQDGKVMPSNWGLRLILKAKPTPQVRTVPIGTIVEYSGTTAPYGFLIADGSTALIADYQDLYDWANTNGLLKEYSEYQAGVPHSCYYKANNNTEFIIPNLAGVYRRGFDSNSETISQFGTYEQDSAPDIQGTFLSNSTGVSELSGAFSYSESQIPTGFVTTTSILPVKVQFKASNDTNSTLYPDGNPYGRKNVVQPKTVITLPILKW